MTLQLFFLAFFHLSDFFHLRSQGNNTGITEPVSSVGVLEEAHLALQNELLFSQDRRKAGRYTAH